MWTKNQNPRIELYTLVPANKQLRRAKYDRAEINKLRNQSNSTTIATKQVKMKILLHTWKEKEKPLTTFSPEQLPLTPSDSLLRQLLQSSSV
ncbi:hypothetical protein K3495_g3812 [Podosphaera aphanis]|nr:hypothetical protein K3495_g3812 [Podosphaera aphanis]